MHKVEAGVNWVAMMRELALWWQLLLVALYERSAGIMCKETRKQLHCTIGNCSPSNFSAAIAFGPNLAQEKNRAKQTEDL